MDNRPIGVFDSGIGGMTVLSELLKVLPNENYYYYADTKHLPYGNKTNDRIIEYVDSIIQQMQEKKVKTIIYACNTATSIAYQIMNQKYKTHMMNIILPVSKTVVEKTKNKKIGVCATSLTVKSDIYKQTIAAHDPTIKVFQKACPEFVEMIENNNFKEAHNMKIIETYIKELLECDIDTLILGCTHYPLLTEQINKISNHSLQIIDPGKYIARECKMYLETSNLLNDEGGRIEWDCSGDEEAFKKKVEMFGFLMNKSTKIRK